MMSTIRVNSTWKCYTATWPKFELPGEETFNRRNDFNNINLESARELERYEQSLQTNIAQIVKKDEDEDEFVIKAYVDNLKKRR